MNLDNLILVSVDDHLVEPPDMFDNHMPASLKDKAPKLQKVDGKDKWVFQGEAVGVAGLAVSVWLGGRMPMPAPGATPPARMMLEHSLVAGSPATVIEKLTAVANTGIGGLIMQFRLGPMSYEDTAASLTLFREKVRPFI